MQSKPFISSTAPDLTTLEKSFNSIPNDSPYKNIAELGLNQIKSFEQKILGINEDELLTVKIETDLNAGAVSLNLLGLMSGGVQRIYTSIFNELFGNKNSKGKIPSNVINSSELIMVAASPGSFNMHIKPKDSDLEVNKFTEESLDSLSNMFSRLLNNDDASFVVEEYGVRTFRILNNWFDDLKKNHIEFSIKNKNTQQINFNLHNVTVTKEKLSYLNTSEKNETEEFTGIIDSANTATKSISFIPDAGGKIIAYGQSNIFENGITINTVKYKILCKKTVIKNQLTNVEKIRYTVENIIEILHNPTNN